MAHQRGLSAFDALPRAGAGRARQADDLALGRHLDLGAGRLQEADVDHVALDDVAFASNPLSACANARNIASSTPVFFAAMRNSEA